jgi:hypothetical protein
MISYELAHRTSIMEKQIINDSFTNFTKIRSNQTQHISYKEFTKHTKKDRLRLRELVDKDIDAELPMSAIKFEPFQVFIFFKNGIDDKMIVHDMAPGYRYNDIVAHVTNTFGLLKQHFYLQTQGILLHEFHYFACTGKPYFVEVHVRGFGGMKILKVNKKCKICNKRGHDSKHCPDDIALSSEESSKGKSELSSEMSSHSRSYFKQLLKAVANDTIQPQQLETLAIMCDSHPEELKNIKEEISIEESISTKEECNYNTKKYSNNKERSKQQVRDFAKNATQIYTNSEGGKNDFVNAHATTYIPESKLKVSQSGVNPITTNNSDPFEMISFTYHDPKDSFFLLTGDVVEKVGYLPLFAVQYLNRSVAPASTPNIRNMESRFFQEDITHEYLDKLRTNTLVNHFKDMVYCYYGSLQHDKIVEHSYKYMRISNAAKRRNKESMMDDANIGITIPNLYKTGKHLLNGFIKEFGCVAINAFVTSSCASTLTAFKKSAISYTRSFGNDVDEEPELLKPKMPCGYMPPVKQDMEEVSIYLDDLQEGDQVVKFEPILTEEEAYNSVIEDFLEEYSVYTESCPALEIPKSPIFEEPKMNKAARKKEKKKDKKISKKNLDIIARQKEEQDEEIKSATLNDLMLIFPSVPTFSVIIEECVKQFIPYGATIVGRLDDWVHSSGKRRTKWHKNSLVKFPGFFKRVRYHLKHNDRAVNCDLSELYEYYSTSKDLLPDCVEPTMNNLNNGAFLKAVPLPLINKELLEIYPYPRIGNSKGAEVPNKELPKFYPLFYAINNYVTYADTWENFVATVLCRLCYPKTLGPIPGEWKFIIDNIVTFHFDFKPNHEVWFKKLTKIKRGKVKRHMKALDNGDQIDTRTKVFLKMRELLKKSSKGYGRLIFNVSSKYLYLLGDFLDQFSNAMASDLFPCIPKFTISKSVCFYYASKFNDKKMNVFVNIALSNQNGKYALVLGDDTNVIDRDKSDFIETDFTAYDSTQVTGGALDAFPALLDKMGFHEQKEMYAQMYAEPVIYKHHTGKSLQLPKPYNGRMSGEMGTSVANSWTTCVATAAVLEGKTTYARLGFVAKTRISKVFDTVFLKGIWLWSKSKDYYYWVRLPSFILKLKSFTPVKSCYPKTWSIAKCQQQMLWSQWLGFGNLQTNWFMVALTKLIKDLCPMATNVTASEEYKVYTEERFYIEDFEYDTFMFNRYHITREEMEDFLGFVNTNASALPIIYQHSVSDKLIAVDG